MKIKTKIELLIFILYFLGLSLIIYMGVQVVSWFPFSWMIMFMLSTTLGWLVFMVYVEHALLKKYGVEKNG